MTNAVLLPLTQGKLAIIDKADFEKVGHFKWHVMKTPGGNFYARRNFGSKSDKGGRKALLLHCEILGVLGVDHKNGDGLDCRRENLRPATSRQNHQAFKRKIAGASSKFRGVAWHVRRDKWVAGIRVNKIQIHLGCFKNEKDAAKAYDRAATANGFFKEALNFP